MKSMRLSFCAATAVALLTYPLIAAAGIHRGKMDPPGMGPKLTGMKVFLELKLTPAQQEEMLNIVSRYEKEGKTLHDEARRARRTLASVMRAEKLDETALRQAYREVSSAREEMLVFRAAMMHELKGLLTPEQVGTLDRMKKDRGGKCRARMRAWGQPDGE